MSIDLRIASEVINESFLIQAYLFVFLWHETSIVNLDMDNIMIEYRMLIVIRLTN